VHLNVATWVVLIVTALFLQPASALDCNNKPTNADKVICDSEELRQTDELMWSSIRQIENFIDEKEFNKLVADQHRWRDEWVQSCGSGSVSPRIITCLWSKASPQIALGVDALAFVANGGGAAYICDNFPMYVVAVRPGLPAEVMRVPDRQGNRRDAACLGVSRTPQGFSFGVTAQAAEDGWSQQWTPKDGLSPAVVRKFAPVAGTTMKTASGAVVHNEQFYRALQRYAEARGLSPEALLEDFAWTSDDDGLRLDDPPVRFRIIDGCSGWYGPGLCSNRSNARALYDPQADRLFFMWAKNPKVTCSAAYHHNNAPGELESETFYPPLNEWPTDVFDALKRSYCLPK
jgi:hypothetical protein